MAQYKRIPYEMVEHTEIARKNYLEYERGKDAPDEAEVEAGWISKRKMLRDALDALTPRQREVFVLKTAYLLTEVEIACWLNIAQQVVSRHYRKAQVKLKKFAVKITDT